MKIFSSFKLKILLHYFAILFLSCLFFASCGGPAEPEVITPTLTFTPTSQPTEKPVVEPSATPIATLQPTETAEPSFTPTAVLETVSLSNNNLSEQNDEDILDELYYFVGGGGGDINCKQVAKQPYFETPNDTLLNSRPTQEIQTSFELASCNWPVDDEIKLTINFPDGQEYSKTFIATDKFGAGLTGITHFFKTDIRTDPFGIYTVIWSNEAIKLQHEIEVTAPPAARMTRDSWEANTGFLLYGFRPNEEVKLVVLKPTNNHEAVGEAAVQGVANFQTNNDGQLHVKLDFKEDDRVSFIAIGNESGEVPEYTSAFGRLRPRTTTSLVRPISDNGIKACRIDTLPERSVVINQDVTIRNSEGEIVTELKTNQRVKILVSNPIWQEVSGQPGSFGWHWSSHFNNQRNRGLIWQEYFAECEELQ